MMENGSAGDGPAAPPPTGSGSWKRQMVPQLQLPAGYHLELTDEELLDIYLRCKIERRTPPLDFVNEVDIMRRDPEKLIEEYRAYGENRWFFFTRREPSKTKKKDEPNWKVVVNGVGESSWSATGSVVKIRRTEEMDQGTIIGTKRVLTYKSVRSADKDKWSMHEYVMRGQSQMGQYVLCAIQLKQTYEAEKKSAKEGKSGNKCNLRVPKEKRDKEATTSQGQEEPPHKEISVDTCKLDAHSMQIMFEEEEHAAHALSFAHSNHSLVQPVQTEEEPLVLCNQEQLPLCCSDQFMITPAYSGNVHYQQPENNSIAFGDALDDQCHNAIQENGNVCSDDMFLDDNIEDMSLDGQSYNQDNSGILIGGLEDGIDYGFYDNLVLTDEERGCGDAVDQSMVIQPVKDCMGDDGDGTYINDALPFSFFNNVDIDSFLVDGDNVREPIESYQTSLIWQDGLQQSYGEESTMPTDVQDHKES